jgi:hypothetical protein
VVWLSPLSSQLCRISARIRSQIPFHCCVDSNWFAISLPMKGTIFYIGRPKLEGCCTFWPKKSGDSYFSIHIYILISCLKVKWYWKLYLQEKNMSKKSRNVEKHSSKIINLFYYYYEFSVNSFYRMIAFQYRQIFWQCVLADGYKMWLCHKSCTCTVYLLSPLAPLLASALGVQYEVALPLQVPGQERQV